MSSIFYCTNYKKTSKKLVVPYVKVYVSDDQMNENIPATEANT